MNEVWIACSRSLLAMTVEGTPALSLSRDAAELLIRERHSGMVR
jgi:hypothetical protein